MEWPSYSARALGQTRSKTTENGLEVGCHQVLSVPSSLLTPPAPPDPCAGTAKTGPKLGSRTALSQALSNDKNEVMGWEAGREEADGKTVEVRVPDLIESRLYVCLCSAMIHQADRCL